MSELPSGDPTGQRSLKFDSTERQDRRFRITLCTLVVVCVCLFLATLVGLAFLANQRAQQQAIAVKMLRAKGVEFYVAPSLLSEVFGHNPFAPVLEVYAENSSISDLDLKYVAQLSDVKKLQLSRTGVTDKGMVHVATLQNLELLELGSTSVSDNGLHALRSLPRLRFLYLGGTKVTDNGLKHLAKMSALESVTLSSCFGVTDDGIRDFRPLCARFVKVHR